MVIAGGAGGGYDLYARLLTQHMTKHIPGAPSIVNQNMPGAAGITATNWAAKIAPKDGSVIVATYHVLLLEPLFGNSAADYDPTQFEWLGSIGKQQNICITWHTSPVKTIEQARDREVTVSSTGASGHTTLIPRVLNTILGTKFKVIGGYQTAESRLAVERGEVDGICGLSWTTLKTSSPDWINGNRMNMLVQTGARPMHDLPNVPLLIDYVKAPDDRQVLNLIAAPDDMGRPFLMPPGTPKPIVAVMRKAFDAVMADKAFLDDAAKRQMEVDPLTGEEMERMLKAAYATPKPLVERAVALMRGDEKAKPAAPK
jgi:tripartite-type tricarboxylate transporter receptor subunit TctC